MCAQSTRSTAIGLFAGIGGIELGLHDASYDTVLLCEIDDYAQRTLRAGFPDVDLESDVRDLQGLPKVDLWAAGFPCQDLSQAGMTAGIGGAQSGLVNHVFRLLEDRRRSPRWLLLENVPFMLQLDGGRAMRLLTESLAELGFTWAYRVIDARAFGLPQRRQRVLLLASRTEDPREVLFTQSVDEPPDPANPAAFGFYWTEGLRGLGWAVEAIPTLKGGSAVGIPSAPAIWTPEDGGISTPDIRDAERLQGFPTDWTLPAATGNRPGRKGPRWKLVGNAVSVPVSQWIGERLREPGTYEAPEQRLPEGVSWPIAAWGQKGVPVRRVDVTPWPVVKPYRRLSQFLKFPTVPLSERATLGFVRRLQSSTLRRPQDFEADLLVHADRMRGAAVVA